MDERRGRQMGEGGEGRKERKGMRGKRERSSEAEEGGERNNCFGYVSVHTFKNKYKGFEISRDVPHAAPANFTHFFIRQLQTKLDIKNIPFERTLTRHFVWSVCLFRVSGDLNFGQSSQKAVCQSCLYIIPSEGMRIHFSQ